MLVVVVAVLVVVVVVVVVVGCCWLQNCDVGGWGRLSSNLNLQLYVMVLKNPMNLSVHLVRS